MSDARQIDAPDVARRELRQFLKVAEQAGMNEDLLRRSLRLSGDDWQRWVDILDDAPLPRSPALPVLLRHLGYLTNRLAERVGHVQA